MGCRHHLHSGSDRERVNYRAVSAPRMQQLPRLLQNTLITAAHNPPSDAQSVCLCAVRTMHTLVLSAEPKHRIVCLISNMLSLHVYITTAHVEC